MIDCINGVWFINRGAFTYAFMATYMGSLILYSNACLSENEDILRYTVLTESLNVTLPLKKNGLKETVENMTADQGYKFCDQEVIRYT